jgi:glycosyltransferase involved in cell wall biosynthesis
MLDAGLAPRFELTPHTTASAAAARGVAARALNSLAARALGFDGAWNLDARDRLAAFRAALAAGIDLVHLHSSHGYDFWLAARMARSARDRGVPAIHQLHGNFDVVYPRWSRVRRAAFARALRLPERLVVLSQSWRRWFADHVDAERIEVLPNCVDVARFPMRCDPPPGGALRLLFVGTRDPDVKGAYDVLAAAPEIARAAPEVRFTFVGEDTADLESRCVHGTELARYVEFAGAKRPDEMPACYAAADVLLLPSHREAMPMALLEAMATGLPVVASAIAAIPEVLAAPEGGVLIAPGDRAALVRGVLGLARDPDWRRRAGAANRARIEREFDRAHYAERLCALYLRVLEKAA